MLEISILPNFFVHHHLYTQVLINGPNMQVMGVYAKIVQKLNTNLSRDWAHLQFTN